MNCQDVTGILDDESVEAMDPVRRRQAEIHVAGCAECARAWNAQASLALLPDMPLPADFRSRCRAVVAASSRRAGGRSMGRRVLLGGSLAALAAAAAAVTFLLRPTAPVSSPLVRDVPVAGAAPRAATFESAEPAAGMVPAAVFTPAATTLFTVHVAPPKPPVIPPVDGPGGDSSGPSAALSEEMRAYLSEPARVQALQSLYNALVVELGKVPGLVLVDSEPAEVAPSSRIYRVRIDLVTMTGPSGRIEYRDGKDVPVAMLAEELQPGGKSTRRWMEPAVIDVLAACTGAARVANTPCNDARGTAAQLVSKLRQEVFPPDASLTRGLQARFKDLSLDPAQRFKALAELFKLQNQTGDMSLLRDPGVVHAAIELAASSADPVHRARIWRSMRGSGHAALIEPLINSLLQDADDVRLAAVEILTADFSGDARVRAALEAAAVRDRRPLLRAAAERGLLGEGKWRQYVAASLKDTSLPAAQRVEALVYYLYPVGPDDASSPNNPDYWQIMQEMFDDAALAALAETLPRAGKLRGGSQGLLVSNIGYLFSKNAAITGMLLEFLEHDPQPRMRTIAGEVLARTRASEPRVRDALAKTLNSDPDPGVRGWIRQVMGNKAP